MKDFLKVLYVATVGLLVAVFAYPAIHEIGHFLAALTCGCTVAEIHVFPIAFIKCDIGSLGSYDKIFVGLSGMASPFLLSVPRVKNFRLWFPLFVMRGICFLSFLISGFSIILSWRGKIVQNEDIIQLLGICADGKPIIYAFVIVMTVLSFVIIAVDKPIKRFLAYLK